MPSSLKYPCLVLDHDDTVVNSTASIHCPAFAEYLAIVRPGINFTVEDYFRKNFHPGFLSLCVDELKFTEDELKEEEIFWKNYVRKHIPSAYAGIREILENHRKKGGLIVVVSHSMAFTIERDYRKNQLPTPDMIIGWEIGKEFRKPNSWPLRHIMARYSLSPDQILVVDDSKPGYDMTLACGVDFAAAGWAYDLPEIEVFLRKNSTFYCKTVHDLKNLLET